MARGTGKVFGLLEQFFWLCIYNIYKIHLCMKGIHINAC